MRPSTKAIICDLHIKNYRYNYADPLTKNDGRLMPYIRDDDGRPIVGTENCPELDETILEDQEQSTPGISKF